MAITWWDRKGGWCRVWPTRLLHSYAFWKLQGINCNYVECAGLSSTFQSVIYFMLRCPISSTADQATRSKSKRSTASIIIFPTVVFKGWHSYFLQIVADRSWCCELPKLSLFIRCNKNVYLIVFTKIEMGGLDVASHVASEFDALKRKSHSSSLKKMSFKGKGMQRGL